MSLPPKEGPGDPSMDDILASIRRILNEDEAPPAPRQDDDLLLLDRSMMLPENELPSDPDHSAPAEAPAPAVAPASMPGGTPAGTPALGELVRRVSADRPAAAGRGLTVEELVREELRPLLRAWLDAHLPPLVERLARAEIERLVSRAATEG